MELKFEEVNANHLDNQNYPNFAAYNVNQPITTNQVNYWEKKDVRQPKKKVSFDDILNNMNLVVTQDGVLQYMRPLQQEYNQGNNSQYNQGNNSQYSQYNQQSTQMNISEPIHPAVKHSPIYNKYFKDYRENEQSHPSGPRRPKTIQELKQMLREDKIREIQQKIRISQIKSKKMLFTNINGIHMTKNNLRVMAFK